MATTADPAGGSAFCTFKEVCRLTRLSRRTVYRYLARKIFPVPGRTPGGTLIWRRREILDWMDGLWGGPKLA